MVQRTPARDSIIGIAAGGTLNHLMNAQLAIDEIINKVGFNKEIEQNEPVDGMFQYLKDKLLLLILAFKEDTMRRQQLRSAGPNTIDSIRLQISLQHRFADIITDYDKLNRTCQGPPEPEKVLVLEAIAAQIRDCDTLLIGEMDDVETFSICDFKTQMEAADIPPPKVLGEWREPTEEEFAVMERWADRDVGFDDDIRGLGENVIRLTAISEQIRIGAIRQKELGVAMGERVDIMNDDVIEANALFKRILLKGLGNKNVMARLIMSFLVVCLAVWFGGIIMSLFA